MEQPDWPALSRIKRMRVFTNLFIRTDCKKNNNTADVCPSFFPSFFLPMKIEDAVLGAQIHNHPAIFAAGETLDESPDFNLLSVQTAVHQLLPGWPHGFGQFFCAPVIGWRLLRTRSFSRSQIPTHYQDATGRHPTPAGRKKTGAWGQNILPNQFLHYETSPVIACAVISSHSNSYSYQGFHFG